MGRAIKTIAGKTVSRAMVAAGVVAAALFVPMVYVLEAKAGSRHIGQGWWYGENIDHETSEGNAFIARAAKGHPADGSGAGLMVVCQSDVKTLGLMIDWDERLPSGDFVDIQLRVDRRAPMISSSWYVDRSTSAIFDEAARKALKEMQRGTKVMHARLIDGDDDDDDDDDNHILAFDLAGFKEAILRVLDRCAD